MPLIQVDIAGIQQASVTVTQQDPRGKGIFYSVGQIITDNRELRAQVARLECERDTLKAQLNITTSQSPCADTTLIATKAPCGEASRRNNVDWIHSVVETARVKVQTLKDLEADRSMELESCRTAFTDLQDRAKTAEVEHARIVSEQKAELVATNMRLQEETTALSASEQMNECLMLAIEDVQNICLS